MPNHSSYKLKQAQYASIYNASERTVRNWMKKGAPLDDPHAMFAGFLPGQRSVGAEIRHADPLEVEARYQQAIRNPVEEAHAVLASLGDRLDFIQRRLCEARNFARKYQPTHWDEVATKLDTMMRDMDSLFEVLGIGEDFAWPEQAREDLTKPIMLLPWPPGSRPADDDGDEESESGDRCSDQAGAV